MRTILAVLCALVILTACASPAPSAAPVPSAPAPAIVGPSEAAEPPSHEPAVGRADKDIEALVAKSIGAKSMKFDIANLPDKGAWATYSVRGSKARVDLVTPISMTGWSADTVFLDLDAKTAEARCIAITNCKKDNRAGAVPYDRYGIEMPLSWGDRVVYGQRTGAVTFNNRQTTVVRWTEDGKTFEAYIDPFYGVVQRVAVLDMSKDPPATIGGYEYRNMAYNTVTEAAVTTT